MIAQFIEGHQSSWDELLPEISLAVNTSVADSTGFSPAFLMQGREPRLPAALYDQQPPARIKGPGQALQLAKSRQHLLRQHQLSNAAEGFAAKLAPKFDGPYRVVKFMSPNIVRLVRPGERKKTVANVSQLKPFHQEMTEDGEGPDPTDVVEFVATVVPTPQFIIVV
ncbi:uncharacterized protein LOC135439650 [Drosophila montana]|uniref:uncharacterized protein LOC135439650 n=1 Tax=Drosophila montana TaxID=40370 RepID=UPI00313F0018